MSRIPLTRWTHRIWRRNRWNQSRKASTAQAARRKGTASPKEYEPSRTIPRERLSWVAARPRMPPRIGPIQEAQLEHPQAIEPEENDEHAAHPLDPDFVVLEGPAQYGGAGA